MQSVKNYDLGQETHHHCMLKKDTGVFDPPPKNIRTLVKKLKKDKIPD